jgi:hypothetical protein
MFANDPVFAGQMVGLPAPRPRATPAPPRPQPQPAPPVVAARPVSVPSPDELGIRLDLEPQAVTVPGPDELGIHPD